MTTQRTTNNEQRATGHELEKLLDALESIPPDQHEEFLEQNCTDPELRRRALAIVAAETDSRGFLDQVAERLGRAPKPDAPSDLSGRRIGAWRLLTPLGRGGMGVVYEAERADGAFEQRVALKMLATALTGGEAHQRFLAERQILAGLEHQAIAHIVDGGVTDDGTPWFAMERIEGERIDVYCDRLRLGIDERLALFLQVCDAVEHAHRRLVVHRDLKPANVLVQAGDRVRLAEGKQRRQWREGGFRVAKEALPEGRRACSGGGRPHVTDDGQVKLLDFGIARLLEPEETDPDSPPTSATLRLMTPEYASPEQARGEPVTTASDVYQLGLVLYELLSGHRPYVLRRHSASEIERVICEQAPTRLSVAVTRPKHPLSPESGERVRERGRGQSENPLPPALSPEGRGGVDGEQRTTNNIYYARRSSPARLRRQLRGDLETIVAKALSKEPERRYGSADRLAQDLRRHLDGRPVEAQPDTLFYRWGKFLDRHTTATAATALVFLLVTGMTAFYTLRIQSERDRAQTEAVKARQVSDFLVGLFRSAAPSEARGVDVAARRELLDQGLERVDRELANQPEMRADILHVLGRTYLELGAYDTADELLTRALDSRRERAGTMHPEVGDALREIGRLRFMQGNYDAARAQLEEAQRIFESTSVNGDAGLASVLNVLGQVHRNRGAYEESLVVLERALEAQRRVTGERSEAVASILRNIGTVLFEMDEYERAERHYEEALEIFEREVGDDHPKVGHVLQDLARTRLELGKLTDLEAAYRRSLAITRQAYGPVHFNVGVSLNNLGHFLTADGRDEEAVEILEQAVEVFREALDPDHPATAVPFLELGDAHLAGGRLLEARSHYHQSVTHGSRASGEQVAGFDPVLAYSLARLTRVEDELGNSDAASALRDRALIVWRQAPESIGAQLAPGFLELVAGLEETRRCGDAIPLLERALGTEAARRSFSPEQIAELEATRVACGNTGS